MYLRYIRQKYFSGGICINKEESCKVLSVLLAVSLILLGIMLLFKGQSATVRYIIITGNTFLGYQFLSYICC